MNVLKGVVFWAVVALALAVIAGVALWLGGRLPGGLLGQQGTLSSGLVWLMSFTGIVTLVSLLLRARVQK